MWLKIKIDIRLLGGNGSEITQTNGIWQSISAMQPTSTKFINQMITFTNVKVHDKKLKKAKRKFWFHDFDIRERDRERERSTGISRTLKFSLVYHRTFGASPDILWNTFIKTITINSILTALLMVYKNDIEAATNWLFIVTLSNMEELGIQ